MSHHLVFIIAKTAMSNARPLFTHVHCQCLYTLNPGTRILDSPDYIYPWKHLEKIIYSLVCKNITFHDC